MRLFSLLSNISQPPMRNNSLVHFLSCTQCSKLFTSYPNHSPNFRQRQKPCINKSPNFLPLSRHSARLTQHFSPLTSKLSYRSFLSLSFRPSTAVLPQPSVVLSLPVHPNRVHSSSHPLVHPPPLPNPKSTTKQKRVQRCVLLLSNS